MNFVVVPIDRQPSFGFWLQADSAEEARRLVALNVPSMGSASLPDLAECWPDETHSPRYGAIIEGTVRTYIRSRWPSVRLGWACCPMTPVHSHPRRRVASS
jgi:hypothetical protein